MLIPAKPKTATVAILLVIAVVCVITVAPLAWLEFGRRHSQEEALISIQEVANVSVEYHLGRVVGLYIGGEGFDNTQSAQLKNFQWLTALELNFTSLTDNDLDVLQDLPRLKTLWLATEEISNQGIQSLCCLQNLEWLQITTRGLSSDDLLRRLTGLRKLQFLTLISREIDPNVLEFLRKELPDCQVTIETPSGMETSQPE